jgi:hypothetical protein
MAIGLLGLAHQGLLIDGDLRGIGGVLRGHRVLWGMCAMCAT